MGTINDSCGHCHRTKLYERILPTTEGHFHLSVACPWCERHDWDDHRRRTLTAQEASQPCNGCGRPDFRFRPGSITKAVILCLCCLERCGAFLRGHSQSRL